MKWFAVDKKYVNYLKKYDKLVPNIEYTGKLKCFLGVVFNSKNSLSYFAPLTSYKPKFVIMNNSIDFFKIVGKQGKIYGAIDINNMIPVSKNDITEVTLEKLPSLRTFHNKRELKSYWKLLQTELKYINENVLLHNAEKLYRFVTNLPNSPLAERCCNFPLLEEKCIEYNRVQDILPTLKYIDNEEDLFYIYDSVENKNLFEECALNLDKEKNIGELRNIDINNFYKEDSEDEGEGEEH